MGLSDLRAWALDGLPEVRPGDDLAALLRDGGYEPGDVLVVAHKIVSKAEGALRRLEDVVAGDARAGARARARQGPPPRAGHPRRVRGRACAPQRGVLICRTHHGFVCANAGVDTSNAPEDGALVVLPARPRRERPRAARRAAATAPPSSSPTPSAAPGATGSATWPSASPGSPPLDDWRGRRDPRGLELRATAIAVADEAAAAADLVRDKASRQPAVVVRGLARHVTDEDGPGAAALIRPLDEDLFG